MTQTPSNGQQGQSHAREPEKTTRQCVKYSFFKVDSAFRRLPHDKQTDLKLELIGTIRSFNRRMLLRAYSLFGLRGDVDFMLWQVAENVDAFNALASAIFSTGMAPYLQTPYSLLGMTRKSIYDIGLEGAEAEERIIIQPGDGRYLFVYPFTKTRAWYALTFEQRQEMMAEHIKIGRKYPQFKLNTIYSFGLDDQEFVVAFEGDSSAAFLDLVMELREIPVSQYTLRDTPTFTCINMTLPQVLDSIGGAQVADEAGPDVETHDGGWAKTIALAELPAGTSTRVYLGSQQIALFNVDGQVYAINNRCPHARGPLCEGTLHANGSGPAVTCPWHKADFDLATGEAIDGPVRTPVRTYAVRVDDDGLIYVAEKVTADSAEVSS
jgi:NAD(P)H-dependent nitrite reductase small subunit